MALTVINGMKSPATKVTSMKFYFSPVKILMGVATVPAVRSKTRTGKA